mgnify:CR=1 FL=1
MVVIRIDPAAPEPVFQQIVSAVKRAVAHGRLREGDRLPTVRELAKEVVANPNTVAKAYRTLEAEGVTTSRRGAGTFVAALQAVPRGDERRRRFVDALEAVLAEAVHLGLTATEVRRTVAAALKRLRFEGVER